MRTAEVCREFSETCDALANLSKIPEVKSRLKLLAFRYRTQAAELERVKNVPLAPEAAEP